MNARGRVVDVRAGFADAQLPFGRIGANVSIDRGEGRAMTGTVRAVRADRVSIALHGAADAVLSGAAVATDGSGSLALGTCALGRTIDGCGEPLDGGPRLAGPARSIDGSAPPLRRRRLSGATFWTGIRVLDGLLPFATGARIGIFGSAGLGKTTLLRSLLQGSCADAAVVALVGERGREARLAFAASNDRTTIVCATGDRSAAERWRAACVAMAQAEALCRRGLDVLLVIDSLARAAGALRELGIAAGEPMGRGGYPPSVVAELAKLLERAGSFDCGSITLVATVLADGDDRDPICEAARSLLDGHVQLCPDRARRGSFPAIDVPASASRTWREVASSAHVRDAQTVRAAIALLGRTSDARMLGVAVAGESLTRAVAAESAIEGFLCQDGFGVEPGRTLAALAEVAGMLTGATGEE